MADKPVVHVVDDDEAARQSLEFLLKSAKLAVETYDSAKAFLEALPRVQPGCIVSDVRMPGMSGIDLLKQLKEQQQAMPVIIMTGHGDVPLAVEAMKFGAADFLEKPFDDEVMLKSIRNAINRQKAEGQRDADRTAIMEKLATLSTRERQVLEGLVAGLPNKSIAYDLSISPRTVEIYRANTMTKMDASSLSELVRMALIAGVVTPANS